MLVTRGYSFACVTKCSNCITVPRLVSMIVKKKCTFYLSVNVFITKVLIGDTIFTSPNGDWTAIFRGLRGHPSHAKVSPPAVQRKYLHF